MQKQDILKRFMAESLQLARLAMYHNLKMNERWGFFGRFCVHLLLGADGVIFFYKISKCCVVRKIAPSMPEFGKCTCYWMLQIVDCKHEELVAVDNACSANACPVQVLGNCSCKELFRCLSPIPFLCQFRYSKGLRDGVLPCIRPLSFSGSQ